MYWLRIAGCDGGKSHSTTGLSPFDNSLTTPALSAISMSPHHIATIPAMDMTSSTACTELSRTASDTADIFPDHAPYTIPIKSINAQI